MEVAIFGAGKIGREAVKILSAEAITIKCIIDNNKDIQGKFLFGIPVIGIDEYKEKYEDLQIFIAVGYTNRYEIKKQLNELGISKCQYYDRNLKYKKERLISYSNVNDLEDVIIYHVLKEVDNIFFIDVGSNDPFENSVTKLLYDMKNACGINIDPYQELIDISDKERYRDVNLCMGVAEKKRGMEIVIQDGLSTGVLANYQQDNYETRHVVVNSLAHICDEYVEEYKNIHLLKIDVEGMEKDVLRGADFVKYRPWVICVESTLPTTDVPCYADWEDILLENDYLMSYTYGVNRYYVAKEHKDLAQRFIGINSLKQIYNIFHASLELI